MKGHAMHALGSEFVHVVILSQVAAWVLCLLRFVPWLKGKGWMEIKIEKKIQM